MNKFKIFYLVVLFHYIAISQDTKFKVCDSLTKKPVENVFLIDNFDNFFKSDEQGIVYFNKIEFPVRTSHISYKTKTISEFCDTIFIEEKNDILKEVEVYSSKRIIKNNIIKPKFSFSNFNPRNFGNYGSSLRNTEGIYIPLNNSIYPKIASDILVY